MTCRIVKVIFSDDCTAGKGTMEDIVRRIPALYTLDGELICRHDVGPDAKAPNTSQIVNGRALRGLLQQDAS